MKPLIIKTTAFTLTLALTVLAAASAQAAPPYGPPHGPPHRPPPPRYYHSPYGHYNGWAFGAGLGLGLITTGAYLAATSPPVYYSPYYAPTPVYPAPVYTQPVQPAVVAAAPPPSDIIAYPAQGQSAAQQTKDRGECERWAMNQSGYDPSQPSAYTTSAQTTTYTRAIGACLAGRGYSIN